MVLGVLFLVPAPSLAQAPDLRSETQITVERILIDARVTNDRGDPILGLQPSDFRVRIDGKPASVESVEWIPETAVGRDLATLDAPPVEVNRSLDQPAPPGRLLIYFFQTDFARNSVRVAGQQHIVVSSEQWTEWLEEEDRVAVFSYDSHLKFRLDFTNDGNHIHDAMEQALLTDEPPPPRTVPMPSLARRLDGKEMRDASSPEAALIIIANALRSIPGPKSLILFGWGLGRLTGGGVVMDRKYASARRALESARVSVFSIDFTEADSHSLEVGLGKVSADTGGFYAKTFRFPRIAIDRLQRTLTGHYELEVRKPDGGARGVHTIETEVLKRGARVMARTSWVDAAE
ncbi:MAG: VWA domain-containing protein [Thermoanaerobaculia bacterium]